MQSLTRGAGGPEQECVRNDHPSHPVREKVVGVSERFRGRGEIVSSAAASDAAPLYTISIRPLTETHYSYKWMTDVKKS